MDTPPNGAEVGRALIAEAKRRMFDESQARIVTCLRALSVEQVWRRPNAQSNSVGNLVLHLSGNIRQWIISGLGGAADERQRDAEFAERGPMPVEELLQRLNETMHEARATLDRVDPATLLQPRRVQGYSESGLSIIVHVVEHLSYHTGQIAYITKAAAATDLGFYRGQNLNAK